MKMSKSIQIDVVPTPSVDRRLWRIVCQWVWNLRLTLGHTMQGKGMRDMQWAPSKERPALCSASESIPQEYGPWR